MAGGQSVIVGGLGLELGTQPPGPARGAVQSPFGALGTAGGPGQRERALRGALRLGVREPLAVVVVGELGELVHGLLLGGGGLVLVLHCRQRPGRSPYVAEHRRGTGLGLASRPCWRRARVGLAPGGWRGRGPVADGPVAEQAVLGFGGLLRQLRADAGLTQDELAEAAGVSQRAISDLERSINRTARKDTAVLLAEALGLDGPACELFIAAARGRVPAGDVLAAGAGAVGAGRRRPAGRCRATSPPSPAARPSSAS